MERKDKKIAMMKDNRNTDIPKIVYEPVNGKLAPEKRLESSLQLSELVTKMATHVICHIIVDYEEQLSEERFSVASAFLQRMTSTHLCNHKLTKEGIVLKYKGEVFQLHEEYKTMTLTRSVYEHLVMFYFLFAHPKTDEERDVVWNYWKINSKKNLMDGADMEDEAVQKEIGELRKNIFSTRLGMECYKKLDEWTALGNPTQNGCIAFFRKYSPTLSKTNGPHANPLPSRGGAGMGPSESDVRRVSYNQAWRYLFGKGQKDMDMLYRHLSIHSHPIYDGLMQYQDQAQKDEGFDGIPLYLSSCFLAYLCRLFLRLIPQGDKMFDEDFTQEEIQVFKALSRITNVA
ncbi:MAG: hypothetical protein IKQ59_11865 [Prevotella sp.]|nr:hypothetical protein [Prevotella sp.]